VPQELKQQSELQSGQMSHENPIVTVVIPLYNCERWISQTLASAQAQTYSDLDIIVVDDGSTDHGPEIVDRAARDDKRIRLIQKDNGGVARARNVGISRALGDFIAPLDADDLWHPEKIARQVDLIQSSSPQVGVVYCWAIEIDEDDCIVPPICDGPFAAGNVLAEVVAKAGIITSGANPLIRRCYLERIGGYDSTVEYCEDWKLQLCLAEICEFALVPAHLVAYRRTGGSRSKNAAGSARSMESISRWIIERWPNMPREIEREMIFNRNSYVAHLSLVNGQILDAVRYKLTAVKAHPQNMSAGEAFGFMARLLARSVGISRKRWLPRKRFTSFKDLNGALAQGRFHSKSARQSEEQYSAHTRR
jgi:glycosyltransferase involved in cell wall biosynthesis